MPRWPLHVKAVLGKSVVGSSKGPSLSSISGILALKHLGTSAACTNRCDKDGSTQALQRQPRVLRYAIALQAHPPEKHGRFGLARRFRLLQVLQRPWPSP